MEHDFALTGFLCENFDAATVKDISYSHWERNVDTSVSEKVSQNIIYRLAKEFYGYTGKNDAMELMQYYSETDGAVHGLYYKDGRYINNDWAVDQKFDLTYLDDKNLSERELSLQVNKIIKDILYTNAGTVDYTICVPALYAVNSFVIKPRKSMIDTPTEAIDTYLNDEFESSFKQILQEELGYRTTEKKEEIKNQISEFIKTFSKDG
ncbi:MAG: hypothetical protein LBO09_01270 [Candidatus Peribacteria bacterium]|nr:hypothetical protein [Candidatus Peribacteria bacterium]